MVGPEDQGGSGTRGSRTQWGQLVENMVGPEDQGRSGAS